MCCIKLNQHCKITEDIQSAI